MGAVWCVFFFSSRRRHTRLRRDWSSDVCSSDLTEIARGLYKKAIELDDNLLLAKVKLGGTYIETEDYDEAMEIYTPALKQAEELGDKLGVGNSLNNIGNVYLYKYEHEKALDYFGRSLAIFEEFGDKSGMGLSLRNMGVVHRNKGDYDKALRSEERRVGKECRSRWSP